MKERQHQQPHTDKMPRLKHLQTDSNSFFRVHFSSHYKICYSDPINIFFLMIHNSIHAQKIRFSYLNDLMDRLWWCFHSLTIFVWHSYECSRSILMGVDFSFRFSNDPGKYNLHFRHLIIVIIEMFVDVFTLDSFW